VTRKLDKSQWRTVFDRLSNALEGKQAEIEVASLSLGDQRSSLLLFDNPPGVLAIVDKVIE
jgi:hypothetical protein